MRNIQFVGVVLLTFALTAHADPIIQPEPFLPLSMGETGRSFATSRATRVGLIGDRFTYFADELNGQFLAMFFDKFKEGEGEKLRIELSLKRAGSDKPIETQTVSPVQTPKLPLLVNTFALKPGEYELSATLLGADNASIASAKCTFSRSDKTDPRVDFPAAGIPIQIHEQACVPGATWPISTGVPMPKMTVRDVSELSLLENGKPTPAQFSVRGTWSPKGYVKWVGVDFTAQYDGAKPREYRLVHDASKRIAPAQPLRLEQTDDAITVDTGALRFVVNRKHFAGIEQLEAHGLQSVGSGGSGASGGGPFIADQNGKRFTAANDVQTQVLVEDAGDLRATIAAKGWYTADDGEKLCKYITRITAYAGQPYVSISHRTVLTATPLFKDERFISDDGFAVMTPKSGNWRFGADGKAISAKGEAVSLHQDRSNHFRILAGDTQQSEGARSNGWFAAQIGPSGGAPGSGEIAGYLRDPWQKFPCELELTPTAMTFHFWPKHGHKAFTDEEEVARNQIYKVRYAHEGRVLDMRIPDNYHKKLEEFDKTENWAGGAELVMVRPDKSKMQYSDGMGAVIGAEFYVAFNAKPRTDGEHLAQADLFQQSPHGIADPAWNCATGVLGPIAARNPDKFPEAEKLLDSAYSFYRRAIIDGGDDYGKWIYGAVHSGWEAGSDYANLTRVWQMCHYQNVFQAWMLYFRSGLREHYEWAAIHSNQHLDVGVANYWAYPLGTHSYSHIGDIGGGIYHCKGFLPWSGNSSTSGHWIDITNYFTRYQLTGDRRGLDMAELWRTSLDKLSASNAYNLPTTCAGYRSDEQLAKIAEWRKANSGVKPADEPQWIKDELAKPAQFNPREVFVPLGEMTQYYQSTWDPQALIYLQQFGEYLNVPFVCTNSPSLSAFGKHWQDWYYALTRDQRVVTRITEFMENRDYHRLEFPTYDTFAAFLYHATGTTRWLAPIIDDMRDQTLNIYENPTAPESPATPVAGNFTSGGVTSGGGGDRYHQYSLAQSNPSAMLLGRLPMFLDAVDKAGFKFEHDWTKPSVMPTRGGRVDEADKWLFPPRGWSNTGITVLAWTPAPAKLAISIDGPKSYGDFRAYYKLYYDWPILKPYDPAAYLKPWFDQQQKDTITFSSPNRFKDTPDHRNIGAGRPESPQDFPYIEVADNDPQRRFYRLEYGGTPLLLPAVLDAQSHKPLPQVAVIAATSYGNGKVYPAPFHTLGVVHAYVRPLNSDAVIELTLTSAFSPYWMPTTLKITDAKGAVIADTSVFMMGKRPAVTVKLDPKLHPLPWRFESASSGNSQFTFTGAPELFFAQNPADFDTILPKLQTSEQ